MSKRTTSENSDAVGLFPFLAVLLCTMGALLVLLIVMAQRVGKSSADRATAIEAVSTSEAALTTGDPAEAAALANELAKVRELEQQIEERRQEAKLRLQSEQERLSHLEDHTRRLEHELVKLTIAARQLKEAEKNGDVDLEQVQRQVAQLNKLILETQAQLEKMRTEDKGKKSFAIVPYKGPYGTYRRPVYIECSAKGITLQPEGVRLQESDFLMRNWPGNPLAAAIRASREYLNAKAARAGEPEPPDPYPMILIRPDGIKQYMLARAAIQSWDSDFGYEFIDNDWQLEFPELPDPQLADQQEHALLIARDRLQRRVQSAPSRFQGFGARSGSGSIAGAGGWGSGNAATGSAGAGTPTPSGDGSSQGENNLAAGGTANGGNGTAGGDGTAASEGDYQYGALGGAAEGGGEIGPPTNSLGDPGGTGDGSPGSESAGTYDRYAQAGGSPGEAGGTGSNSESGSVSGSQASAGSPGGQASSSGGAAAGGAGMSSGQLGSIADTQGSNWAVQGGRQGAVPIRRTIQVVVRKDRMAMLPSRHETRGVGAVGTEISLLQSDQKISEEFVGALRERMEDWGLAGSGLYWRPVLQLNMGPDAQHSAFQVMRLLNDSGVEVRLTETAQKEQGHAQR